uniref:G-protein coupled receptors family 1 profile domain-containing protein n=1 Tax=Panagrolaimus superbus TaxID=310955 RepID=A0A914XSS6_9BILA
MNDDEEVELDVIRQPLSLFIAYSLAYSAVFILGFIGNLFVVLSITLHPSLRTATDHLIFSLALADLFIILFCLPTTLLNNLLTEWQLGAIGCKLSTFLNSTTSCASIFTLVAVTADRYLAICHTLKYDKYATYPAYVIVLIWAVSAALGIPNIIGYDEVLYDLMPPNGTLVARLCVSTRDDDFWHFLTVNVIIAFILPFLVIIVCYALIFKTVVSHRSLAVDARIRDERVKLRVAQMMLTVIVNFLLCWSPLYALYCYFFLTDPMQRDTWFFHFASSVLRPAFQWLSLLSSSLNPLIYIAYSQKYRRAFHQLLLLPCQLRMESFRQATLRSSTSGNREATNTRISNVSGNFQNNNRDNCQPKCFRWSLARADEAMISRNPFVSQPPRQTHYVQHCPGTGHKFTTNYQAYKNSRSFDISTLDDAPLTYKGLT